MGLVTNIDAWGRLVKSWSTGLDYMNTDYANQPPKMAIPANATWALPPMSPQYVAIPGNPNPISVNAVAMTWDTFAGILHNANNILPMGTITNTTNATNVVIYQGDNNTLVLRLPSKLALQQFEKSLLPPVNTTYDIPEFYNGLYKDPTNHAVNADEVLPTLSPDLLQLHANRIGDYTMGNCN